MTDKSDRADARPDLAGIAPFRVDPDAWASRTALYRVAVEAAESTGSRIPSDRQVYAALRARGFAESKRRGVWGFKGLRADEHAGSGRLVPSGTAAAYYRRGDRSDAAREAVFAARVSRRLERTLAVENEDPRPAPRSPWFAEPYSPPAQAAWSNAGRKGPRRRRGSDA